jgi:urease accessory protein
MEINYMKLHPDLTLSGKTITFIFMLLNLPVKASAHLVTTGLGPVYDGIGHLTMTPEDLIPVLILALFAGMRGTSPGRHALFALPLAWFAGGLLGISFENLPILPIPALSFIILGAVVAADLKLSSKWFMTIVIAVGTFHGILNGIVLKNSSGY